MNKLLSSDTMSGVTEEGAFETQLKVWTGGGYTTYGWLDGDDGDTMMSDASYNNKWVDIYTWSLSSEFVPAGQGFWIDASIPSTVTFAGQVLNADTSNVTVESGLNLICNPYPQAISVQDIKTADLPGVTEEGAFETQLKVWTGGGYTTYGWLDADDGESMMGDAAYSSKWVDIYTWEISDIVIEAGQGFWINSDTAGTVTFTK